MGRFLELELERRDHCGFVGCVSLDRSESSMVKRGGVVRIYAGVTLTSAKKGYILQVLGEIVVKNVVLCPTKKLALLIFYQVA